jgi:hypothetical protein
MSLAALDGLLFESDQINGRRPHHPPWRNRPGFRSARFDRYHAATLRPRCWLQAHPDLLSRILVTILPSPVGGVCRTLRRIPSGCRPAGRAGRGPARPQRSRPLALRSTIPNPVRYRATRGTRVEPLQSRREGWHRRPGYFPARSRITRTLCDSRHGRLARSSLGHALVRPRSPGRIRLHGVAAPE